MSDFQRDQPGDPQSNALSRIADNRGLSHEQLRERAIIHRTQAAQPEVEAFRDLRTKLLSMLDGNFITMVAPVTAGCGGSFVARNLAAAFAFDNAKSALLVDCDLRYPSQANTIQVQASRGGLVEYLEHPDPEASPVLYDTGIPRLQLIPVGDSRESGAELFSTMRMRLLLDSLRSGAPNRYIFLDSPPVVGSPDARILAELADVILLVTGYGRNTPAEIANAAAQFDPAKFAGVVFNKGV